MAVISVLIGKIEDLSPRQISKATTGAVSHTTGRQQRRASDSATARVTSIAWCTWTFASPPFQSYKSPTANGNCSIPIMRNKSRSPFAGLTVESETSFHQLRWKNAAGIRCKIAETIPK